MTNAKVWIKKTWKQLVICGMKDVLFPPLSLSLALYLSSTHSRFDSVQNSCLLSSLKTLKINEGCGGKEEKETSERGRRRQTPVTQQFSAQFPAWLCARVSVCARVAVGMYVYTCTFAYTHTHTLSVCLSPGCFSLNSFHRLTQARWYKFAFFALQ